MLSSLDRNVVPSNPATTVHGDQTLVFGDQTTIQGDLTVINTNKTIIQGDVINQTTIVKKFFQDPLMSDTDPFCTLPSSQSSSSVERSDVGKFLEVIFVKDIPLR